MRSILSLISLLSLLPLLEVSPPAIAEDSRIPGGTEEPIVIRGTVLRADGIALFGAEVELLKVLDHFKTQASLLAGREPGAPVHRTRTDARGRFELRDVAIGVWGLRVRAIGFVAMRYPMAPVANSVELPPVALYPAVETPIVVVDSEGRPLAGMSVAATSADSELWTSADNGEAAGAHKSPWRPALRAGWTDARGQLDLPRLLGERLHLRVRRPEHILTVTAEAVRRAKVVYQAEESTRHRIRLLEPDGRPHAGLIAFSRHLWPLGSTDPDGHLTVFGRLDEPLGLVGLASDGRLRKMTLEPGNGEAGGASAEITATLSALVPVHGRVVGPRGKVIAGALVWPGHAPGDFVISDAEGGFSLRVPQRKRSRIQAQAPGYLPRSLIFEASPRRPPDLWVELSPAESVAGRTVDEKGRGLAGVRLSAVALESEKRPRAVRFDSADARARSGVEGEFELAGLSAASSYEIRAEKPGFTPATVTVEADQLGELREVALVRGRLAFGTVRDTEGRPLSQAVVRVAPRAGGALVDVRGVTGEDGRFELRPLPSGTIDVTAQGSGFAPTRVRGIRLPPGEEPVDLGTLILAPGARLAGRVQDEEARPIARAEIYLLDEGFDTARQGTARQDRREAPLEEPTVTADEEGRFELTSLEPENPVELWVDAPGFLPRRLERLSASGDEPIEIVLEAASRLAGVVVDEAGRGVVGAQVSLDVPASATRDRALFPAAAVSDEDGRFLLSDVPPGRVTVKATASGYLPSPRTAVELAPRGEVGDLRLVLEEGAVLSGRVLTTDLEPLGGVRISAGEAAVLSDADGRFQLAGIAPGTRIVEARKTGYSPVRRELEIGLGQSETELILAGGHRLSGRAVDAAGWPLPGVKLALEPRRGGGSSSARSGEDGAFLFEPVADGVYRLRAELGGYVETAPVGVEIAGATLDGVEVMLQAGAVVEGRVFGLDFAEMSQLVVEARAEERSARAGEVDHEGHYRIEGLAADDWTVVASLPGGRRQARARVTLEPGDTDVVRDLEFGGIVLSGTVVHRGEPVPATRVSANGYDVPVNRTVTADSEGRFRMEDLEPGRYWLDLAHHRRSLVHKEDIALGGDREIVVEFVTAGLSGRVTDSETGQGVAEARVTLRQELGAGRTGTVYSVPSDAEGFFAIENLAAGAYRLEAVEESYQQLHTMIEVSAGTFTEGLSLSLKPAQGLEIAALLASGGAPQLISLHGIRDDGHRFAATRRTDESGYARFSTLPAGRWSLLVSGTGGALVEHRITVPGEPLAVVLPDAGRLRVRVPELVLSEDLARLEVLGQDGRRLRHVKWGVVEDSWALTHGRAVVEGVPFGAWALVAVGADGRTWTGSAVTTGGPDVEVSLE